MIYCCAYVGLLVYLCGVMVTFVEAAGFGGMDVGGALVYALLWPVAVWRRRSALAEGAAEGWLELFPPKGGDDG